MEFCIDIYFYETNMTQIRFQIFKTFTNKAERLLQELLSHFNK